MSIMLLSQGCFVFCCNIYQVQTFRRNQPAVRVLRPPLGNLPTLGHLELGNEMLAYLLAASFPS